MSVVDIQEKLIGAQKEFIDALEDAIKRVEQEIKEAASVEESGRAEWEKSIEGYIDELHNVIFSMAEPRFGSEEEHKRIAALRQRLKDLYVDFKNMISR